MKKHFIFRFFAWLLLLVIAPATAVFAQTSASDEKPGGLVVNAPHDGESAGENASAPGNPATEAKELRELGADEAQPPAKKPIRKSREISAEAELDAVSMGNVRVGAGERRSEAVAILGSATVDGEVEGDAVSIMGNTTVNGLAHGDAVSIMGTTRVNGKVSGEVVAVVGDVVLGPDAEVDNVVAIMGKVTRGEGARVTGNVREIGLGGFGDFDGLNVGLQAWIRECLFKGRPLAFGENLGWAWGIAGVFLLLYLLLALLAPKGVVRCAEALELRPGATLLTALLTALLTPVAFTLLAFTGIGVVLIPFIGAAMFMISLFGMASLLAWFGRRVLNTNAGTTGHPFLAVLIGGVIVSLLYTIWIFGFIAWKLFGMLGTGMVIYAMMMASQRERVRVAAAGMAPAPVVPSVAAGVVGGREASFAGPRSATATGPGADFPPPVSEPVKTGEQAAPAGETAFVPPPVMASAAKPVVLPVISAATLPRAGFWLRFGASVIDVILVGIVSGFLSAVWSRFGSAFLFWFAVYCVVMWGTRGTTIGGIICGLKVVRIDDRPLDWGVAVVRALGGFLSLFVAGLGFIWVSFDDERQAWHDKIAGTTIVRVPKGVALL